MLIFRLKALKPTLRQDAAFIGGETLTSQDSPLTGIEFYNTVRELGILRAVYNKAEAGYFDIYEQGKNFIFGIGKFFQYLHNGVLPTYLVWTLLGMMALFFLLLR